MHSLISKFMADQRWERDFKGIFYFFFRTGHLGVEGRDGRVDGVDPWRMLQFQPRPESALLRGNSEKAFPLGD